MFVSYLLVVEPETLFYSQYFLEQFYYFCIFSKSKYTNMKKRFSNLSPLALIAIILVIASCKKPDTSAPVITLNGAASETISLQGTYTESGATANDNKDGAVTSTISGTVNVNHTGVYTIRYRAVDAAGNIGTAIRTVTVVNDAASMAGAYKGTGSTIYYDTITASPTVNKIIDFSKFGNYGGNTSMFAKVVGSTVKIVKLVGIVTSDTVLAIQIGNPPEDRTFEGSGTITSSTVFTLNYTETVNGTPSNKSETYTKQ